MVPIAVFARVGDVVACRADGQADSRTSCRDTYLVCRCRSRGRTASSSYGIWAVGRRPSRSIHHIISSSRCRLGLAQLEEGEYNKCTTSRAVTPPDSRSVPMSLRDYTPNPVIDVRRRW